MRAVLQTSGGMEPTIKAGEEVAIDYGAYKSVAPERWDVVVLQPPMFPNLTVAKRVIAKPLEVVSLTTSGIVRT